MFETTRYIYRVFVTNLTEPVADAVWFYDQRAGAENLIREANNAAGLAAHPSKRFDTNAIHFQMAMLAYNLNVWMQLFHREPEDDPETVAHITLATARLRFLFIAAKIRTHGGRIGIRYSDQYAEQGLFNRLMDRLRRIINDNGRWKPVIDDAFT